MIMMIKAPENASNGDEEYVIVPQLEEFMVIKAKDPEDAICKFAAAMDSDMHAYFRAVRKTGYQGVLQEAKRK